MCSHINMQQGRRDRLVKTKFKDLRFNEELKWNKNIFKSHFGEKVNV